MTTYQTGKNVQVMFKAQTTPGTLAASGAGATQLRASPASGMNLKKTAIQPTEFRSDGMTPNSRHGSRSAPGEYMADLIVGAFDLLFEAASRGTWLPSFTVLPADITSITTQAGPPSTITAASGSFIAKGVVKGDVIRLTGHSTAANNSKNLRVIGVTATVLTVSEPLITDAVADTTFTITVCKRLTQGNPPVRRAFTFEEYDQDIDASQVFDFARVAGMSFKFTPDATVQVTFKMLGVDMQVMTTSSAPYFTSPTVPAGIGLVCVDGKVRVGGTTDSLDFTSLTIDIDMGGFTQPVIGSVVSPDVFLNNAKISGTLEALRSDMTRVNYFLNETLLDITVLCVEPESEPKDFISFYFGATKAMGNDKQLGNDNAKIESMPIDIGIDQAGSGSSPSMFLISTSAP